MAFTGEGLPAGLIWQLRLYLRAKTRLAELELPNAGAATGTAKRRQELVQFILAAQSVRGKAGPFSGLKGAFRWENAKLERGTEPYIIAPNGMLATTSGAALWLRVRVAV